MFRTQPGELGSGETSFCSSGTHRGKENNDSDLIKKDFSQPPPTLLFIYLFSFKNRLKEKKRFAHLVITNGDMNFGDATD